MTKKVWLWIAASLCSIYAAVISGVHALMEEESPLWQYAYGFYVVFFFLLAGWSIERTITLIKRKEWEGP